MLTDADICWRMLTYDDVQVRGECYTHRYKNNEGTQTEKEVAINEGAELYLPHQYQFPCSTRKNKCTNTDAWGGQRSLPALAAIAAHAHR